MLRMTYLLTSSNTTLLDKYFKYMKKRHKITLKTKQGYYKNKFEKALTDHYVVTVNKVKDYSISSLTGNHVIFNYNNYVLDVYNLILVQLIGP